MKIVMGEKTAFKGRIENKMPSWSMGGWENSYLFDVDGVKELVQWSGGAGWDWSATR